MRLFGVPLWEANHGLHLVVHPFVFHMFNKRKSQKVQVHVQIPATSYLVRLAISRDVTS